MLIKYEYNIRWPLYHFINLNMSDRCNKKSVIKQNLY